MLPEMFSYIIVCVFRKHLLFLELYQVTELSAEVKQSNLHLNHKHISL